MTDDEPFRRDERRRLRPRRPVERDGGDLGQHYQRQHRRLQGHEDRLPDAGDPPVLERALCVRRRAGTAAQRHRHAGPAAGIGVVHRPQHLRGWLLSRQRGGPARRVGSVPVQPRRLVLHGQPRLPEEHRRLLPARLADRPPGQHHIAQQSDRSDQPEHHLQPVPGDDQPEPGRRHRRRNHRPVDRRQPAGWRRRRHQPRHRRPVLRHAGHQQRGRLHLRQIGDQPVGSDRRAAEGYRVRHPLRRRRAGLSKLGPARVHQHADRWRQRRRQRHHLHLRRRELARRRRSAGGGRQPGDGDRHRWRLRHAGKRPQHGRR